MNYKNTFYKILKIVSVLAFLVFTTIAIITNNAAYFFIYFFVNFLIILTYFEE